MELRNFISESLVQILKGIEDAHEKIKAEGNFNSIYNLGQVGHLHKDQTETVDFEVLVNVEGNESSKGGAKISVFSIVGVDMKRELASKHFHQNRIKFSVPVSFTKGTLTSS